MPVGGAESSVAMEIFVADWASVVREVLGSSGWQTGRACNELRNFSNGKS